MDKCKFCEAELEEGVLICPACGKEQEEPACEETCQCGEECTCECGEECTCEETECVPCRKNNKGWRIGALILTGVILLGILGFFIAGLLQPAEDGVLFKNNYTVEDTELYSKGSQTVATLGDQEMDNSQLQLYYWSTALNFVNTYAAYGLVDTTKGLHEQAWDDSLNYQQFFLDMAFDAWQETQVICALAKEAGYQLPQEVEAELEAIPGQLEQMLGTDYASVDELLQAQLFPGVNQEGYLKYIRDYEIAGGYLETLEASIDTSDEQVEIYFDSHEEGYAENGVTKQAISADVRHILIQPEGDTEEDLAACLAKAEALLEEWKNGAATEESFAEMANTHTADGGSSTTGGLYTDITPSSSYVPNFLNWAVDASRVVGDTGIVQSEYGYHIMYYVGGELVETDWREIAKNDMITEAISGLIEGGMERWPMMVNYENVVLGHVSLSG